jgi:hypothetical protein
MRSDDEELQINPRNTDTMIEEIITDCQLILV